MNSILCILLIYFWTVGVLAAAPSSKLNNESLVQVPKINFKPVDYCSTSEVMPSQSYNIDYSLTLTGIYNEILKLNPFPYQINNPIHLTSVTGLKFLENDFPGNWSICLNKKKHVTISIMYEAENRPHLILMGSIWLTGPWFTESYKLHQLPLDMDMGEQSKDHHPLNDNEKSETEDTTIMDNWTRSRRGQLKPVGVSWSDSGHLGQLAQQFEELSRKPYLNSSTHNYTIDPHSLRDEVSLIVHLYVVKRNRLERHGKVLKKCGLGNVATREIIESLDYKMRAEDYDRLEGADKTQPK